MSIATVREALISVVSPIAGIGLTIYLALEHQLVIWHGPFLLMLIFGPTISGAPNLGKIIKRVGEALEEQGP